MKHSFRERATRGRHTSVGNETIDYPSSSYGLGDPRPDKHRRRQLVVSGDDAYGSLGRTRG